jgi:hypothetical protein
MAASAAVPGQPPFPISGLSELSFQLICDKNRCSAQGLGFHRYSPPLIRETLGNIVRFCVRSQPRSPICILGARLFLLREGDCEEVCLTERGSVTIPCLPLSVAPLFPSSSRMNLSPWLRCAWVPGKWFL